MGFFWTGDACIALQPCLAQLFHVGRACTVPPCGRALAVVVCVKGVPKRLSRVFRTDGAFFVSLCRRRRRARQGWQSFCCGCMRWQSCRLRSGFLSSCSSCLRRCSRSSRRDIALCRNSVGRWPEICSMDSACGAEGSASRNWKCRKAITKCSKGRRDF